MKANNIYVEYLLLYIRTQRMLLITSKQILLEL